MSSCCNSACCSWPALILGGRTLVLLDASSVILFPLLHRTTHVLWPTSSTSQGLLVLLDWTAGFIFVICSLVLLKTYDFRLLTFWIVTNS